MSFVSQSQGSLPHLPDLTLPNFSSNPDQTTKLLCSTELVLLTLCGGEACRWLVTVCGQAVTWHGGNYPHHKSQLGGQINTQAAAASWQPRHGHHLDNIGGNSFNIDNVMNTQLYNYIISSLVPSPNIVYLYFHTVLFSKLRNPVVDSGQVTSWRQWLWLRVIRSSLGGK